MTTTERFRFFYPEIEEKVASLQWLSRMIVEGPFDGMHPSRQFGTNKEFLEYRSYAVGDDPRRIDWKAYAKSDRLYVRRFEKDSNVECMLAVDLSGSMEYVGIPMDPRAGLMPPSKGDYARVLAACLAYIFSRQLDSVGAFCSAASATKPTRGKEGFRLVCECLEGATLEARDRLFTSANAVVSAAASKKRSQKGIVFVISDFYEEPATITSFLSLLRSLDARVVLFQIQAPLEATLAIPEPHRFLDFESEASLAAHPRLVRSEYLNAIGGHTETIRSFCLQNGMVFHRVLTDQAIEKVLAGFLIGEKLL